MLRTLVKAPFEPLDRVPLKFVSAKTALLLALTSAKRVSDLSALSVAPSCLRIQGDGSSAILRPNPAFTPKSITSSFRSRVITLNGFSFPPHQSKEEATAHLLCPVRALAVYVKRTEALRKSQQLFVHYREHSQGLRLMCQRGQRLSELTQPEEYRPLSLCKEGCLWRIPAQQPPGLPQCSFIRFYLRDMSRLSMTHSVLGALSE